MRQVILVAALAGCAEEVGVREASPERTTRAVIGAGTASGAVDYLFVLDGSSSMESVLDRVFAGVDALLAEGDVFPPGARIAVTSTTPARAGDPFRPHPAVRKAAWVALEPGFAGLVDQRRIAAFRRVAPPEIASEFALDGCDAWFAPDAANAAGVPCFVAHTQTTLQPVRVEAGLTALGQLLAREALFRDGAAANVVFVSDTHDPGVAPGRGHHDDLVGIRPDFAALAAEAELHQALASFRLHAVAPGSQCTDERWGDPVYFDAAEASGGETLDLCTAEPEDFVDMIRRTVEHGALPQRGVVVLDGPAVPTGVTVDGAPVGWTVSRDGRAVVLDDLPDDRSDVEVRWVPRSEPAPAPARGVGRGERPLGDGARLHRRPGRR